VPGCGAMLVLTGCDTGPKRKRLDPGPDVILLQEQASGSVDTLCELAVQPLLGLLDLVWRQSPREMP
jgi:hypothetical protein